MSKEQAACHETLEVKAQRKSGSSGQGRLGTTPAKEDTCHWTDDVCQRVYLTVHSPVQKRHSCKPTNAAENTIGEGPFTSGCCGAYFGKKNAIQGVDL